MTPEGIIVDIWAQDKLLLFIFFVIPGFVSIKSYGFFEPMREKDPIATVLHAVAYSCFYYGVISWLLILAYKYEFITTWWFVLLALFIFPVTNGILFYWLRKTPFIARLATHPTALPWDYVFKSKVAYWIIITLNDGSIIGGTYDSDSFASSYPEEPQIYLQQLWEISETKAFIKPITKSNGVLVFGKNIKSIEFYE